MAHIIQIRRDTAANWTSANPTLAAGEWGYETDTDKLKIGDGSTAWTSLGYLSATSDATAIHDDQSGEISAITEKTALVAADILLIEDSAASNAKKKTLASTIAEYVLTRPTVTMTVKNTEESGMAKGDLVYVDAFTTEPEVKWADADAAATCKGMLLLINEAITASTTGEAIVFGYVSGLSSLTAGTVYYADTTAGDITSTAPSGSGDIVRVVGYGLSTTELMFNPGSTWIELT